jgi:hypothetical protein
MTTTITTTSGIKRKRTGIPDSASVTKPSGKKEKSQQGLHSLPKSPPNVR